MPSITRSDRRSDISDREILELHTKGLNYRQIAKYFKTESKIIIKRLSRNGIEITKLSSNTRQDINNAQIVELYKTEKSTRKLAEILHTNNVTIRNRLISMGITIPPNERKDIKTDELIFLYVNEKLSTITLGKKFNTTPQLIKTRLKKAGVTMRSRLEAGDLIARKNECVICGKIFRPRKKWTDTTNPNRKTCGDACHSVLMSEIQSGELGSNWIDGSSQVHYQKVLRNEYDQICEICGEEKVRIDTHHIDKNHCNNTKENIRPWCVICHAKYHYITDNRGLKNWNPNTPKLLEFKKRLDQLGIPYNIKSLNNPSPEIPQM